MQGEPLNAHKNVTKERPRQVAPGKLHRDVPSVPDQAPASLEQPLLELVSDQSRMLLPRGARRGPDERRPLQHNLCSTDAKVLTITFAPTRACGSTTAPAITDGSRPDRGARGDGGSWMDRGRQREAARGDERRETQTARVVAERQEEMVNTLGLETVELLPPTAYRRALEALPRSSGIHVIEVTDDVVLAPQADDVDDDPSMARSTPDDQLFHRMSYLGRDFQQGADD